MVQVNMGNEGEGGFDLQPEGDYLAEVQGCEEKTSGKGDPMFSVKLKRVGDSAFLCYDVLMLGGAGWGIGRNKLICLGFPAEGDLNIEAAELIGRRVYVSLKEEEYDGKTKLKVDIYRDGWKAGMWPHNDAAAGPPPGMELDDFDKPGDDPF
jgi:hypothetical protein